MRIVAVFSLLPSGIRSRMVPGINGLAMHVLEAGFETAGRPTVLLLHGFPDLAFGWRKIMLPLAAAGFHVVAPDQRGYGRTTGWDLDFDGDLRSFSLLNLVRDTLGLVSALGLPSVAAVVGHDFGASVAAWCALVRPDVFRAVTLMSSPFAGPPSIPFGTADMPTPAKAADRIHAELAALPRPRKHYQWYYSTREANGDMWKSPQGVHAFLRAYFHHKSADWVDNKPHPLAAWTAAELAKLPTYYVMDLDKGMAETVAEHTPTAEQVDACQWLPEPELGIYALEYARTGFQGGLQWYRCATSGRFVSELEVFAGKTIDVPSCFISGASDWGNHQRPGALEAMQCRACTKMTGVYLIDGAGHWVQQEQPERVSERLLAFLRQIP
jgi:pimeloyl-ACP methyl ester carboxylesterase